MVEAAAVFETGKMVAQGLSSGIQKTVGAGMRVRDFLEKQMEGQFSQREAPGVHELPKIASVMPPRLQTGIKLLFDSAKKLEDTESLAALKNITEQIGSDFYQILFVGHYSAGKSRILNELTGRSLLPEDFLPTTKTLTWLLFGKEEKAFCQKKDDSLTEIPVADLRTIDKDDIPLNLFVFLASEILRTGITLIDSAGLGDPANPDAMEMTQAALREVDAVVLVIDASIGNTQSQRDFIKALQNSGKADHLLVAINKMDKIDESERKDAAADIAKLFKDLGVSPVFIPMSCMEKNICDNGFERFRSKLLEFMENDVQDARLSAMKGKLQAVSRDLLDTCRKKQLDPGQRAELQQKINADLQKKRHEIERMIAHNKREIVKFGETAKLNWKQHYLQIQETVSGWIQGVTNSGQFSNMSGLQGEIEQLVNQFLTTELEAGKEIAAKAISEEVSEITTVPVQELPHLELRLKQGGGWIEAIPLQTGTALAIASLFTKGIGVLRLVGSIPSVFMITVLSPVFNQLTSFVKNMAQDLTLLSQKKKTQAAFEETWLPRVNDAVREKINEFTQTLQDNTETTMRKLLNCYEDAQEKEAARIEVMETSGNCDTAAVERELAITFKEADL